MEYDDDDESYFEDKDISGSSDSEAEKDYDIELEPTNTNKVISPPPKILKEGEDVLQIKDKPLSIEPVEQNILTVYRSNDRSQNITLCGAVNKIPEYFWEKLKNEGIIYKYNVKNLCYDISLRDPEKNFEQFIQSRTKFKQFLEENNITWVTVKPGSVGISKKPFQPNILRMCGDVGTFSKEGNAMMDQLSIWAMFNSQENCWEFTKENESTVVNFMRGHGWKVYHQGQEVEMGYGGYINKFGEHVYRGKEIFISDEFGNLKKFDSTLKQGPKDIPPQNPSETNYKNFDYRIGDIVVWQDKDGVHKGRIEQADSEYFTVLNLDTNQTIPAVKQQQGNMKMFKVIERQNYFEDYPINTIVTSSKVDKGRVVEHDVEKGLLSVETYMGDREIVSIKDPLLKKLTIDKVERARHFRPGMNIKYRLARTKKWEEAVVIKVGDQNLEVEVQSDKIFRDDNGIIYSLENKTPINATVTDRKGDQINFKVAEDMSKTWEIGKDLLFVKDGNVDYIVNLSAFEEDKTNIVTTVHPRGELSREIKLIPLESLSLTIIEKKQISSSYKKPFSTIAKKDIDYQKYLRESVKSLFSIIIKNHYNNISLKDAEILEKNLYDSHPDFNDYLKKSVLIASALEPEDYSIGKNAVFFRTHVKSKMFTFTNLHKATLEHIIPELINNPDLSEDQFSEANKVLEEIQKEKVMEMIHYTKEEIRGGPVKPFMGIVRPYPLKIEPYVMNDIHNICSNIGSMEIPTESLVLCQEDKDFYCFSVHDVVLNIQKAEANNVTPRNPFTEREFDPIFIGRIKEMFMNTESGQKFLESLPKANRNYNLVYGEVAPNRKTRAGVRGVTLSEFIAMNKNVNGKKFELSASALLQDIGLYIVKEISNIIGPNKYADTTTLIRSMDIFLQGTSEPFRIAISEQVGEDINSANLKQDSEPQFYGETRLKNPQRHNKMVYADELMQVEDENLKKKDKKVFETSPVGMLLIGSLIYSLLQIILHRVISVNSEPYTTEHIKDSIMNNKDLRLLFARDFTSDELKKLEVELFGSDSDIEVEPIKIINVAGDVNKEDDEKMFGMQTNIVRSFNKVRPSLLEDKKSKKEIEYSFDIYAGHVLYKLSTKFILEVMNSSDDKEVNKDNMLAMLVYTLNKANVSEDFSQHILTPVRKYSNANTNGYKFDPKGQTIITTAQTNLVTVTKKLEIEKKLDVYASYSLLFAIGALIKHVLSDTNVIKETISREKIEETIENDPDLKKIYAM